MNSGTKALLQQGIRAGTGSTGRGRRRQGRSSWVQLMPDSAPHDDNVVDGDFTERYNIISSHFSKTNERITNAFEDCGS